MKLTVMSALVVLGFVGLLADVQAVAQYEPFAPIATGLDEAVTPVQEATDDLAGNGVAQTQDEEATATPDYTLDESLLIDNGLWEGASMGPCCSKCGGGSGCPPDWYTLQGTRIMSRGTTRKIPFSFQEPSAGTYAALESSVFPDVWNVYNLPASTDISRVVMNSKHAALDVAAGYNATIGHYWCRDRNNNDHFVEFTFWGLNSWSTSATINSYLVPVYDETAVYTTEQATLINAGLMTPTATTGEFVGSLRTPYPTPSELPGATPVQQTLSLAFNDGLQHAASYRSTLNDFEINGRFSPRNHSDRLVLHPNGKWQRECQPGTYMSYLYGVRFMKIDETFRFHSRSQGFFQGNIETGSGDYDIVTYNNLLGLQIGADMTFRKCRWSWGVESKLGPYINFSNQSSTITASVDGMPQFNVDQRYVANAYEASLIGEVGFQATYKFRPNLMGRVAYDFMWVTGLALAPEQLQFVANPGNRINVNGMVFSQGVSFGLEWLW